MLLESLVKARWNCKGFVWLRSPVVPLDWWRRSLQTGDIPRAVVGVSPCANNR